MKYIIPHKYYPFINHIIILRHLFFCMNIKSLHLVSLLQKTRKNFKENENTTNYILIERDWYFYYIFPSEADLNLFTKGMFYVLIWKSSLNMDSVFFLFILFLEILGDLNMYMMYTKFSHKKLYPNSNNFIRYILMVSKVHKI